MAKIDIYEQVTNTIIEALENGVTPWVKDWSDSKGVANLEMPYNAISKNNYNGINVFLLWLEQQKKGYSSNVWLTYKQAGELGGNIIKGEKTTPIIFYRQLRVKDKFDDNKIITIPMIKGYRVFNLEQTEGIDTSKLKSPEKPQVHYTDALGFALSCGAVVQHGGNQPCYYPSEDFIKMPAQDQFHKPRFYESALLHELTHWTGNKKRLNRLESGKKEYAFEELVAELGSAFLCAQLGVGYENNQHENYIDGWLKVLKEDKKAIFSASRKAQEASKFLLNACQGDMADIAA